MVVQRCRASRSTRARGCRQDQVGKAAKTIRLGIVVEYFTEARVFIAFEKHLLLWLIKLSPCVEQRAVKRVYKELSILLGLCAEDKESSETYFNQISAF